MPIVIKTRREIEMMRRAGQIGCEILARMRGAARAGISTLVGASPWPRAGTPQQASRSPAVTQVAAPRVVAPRMISDRL